MSFLVLNLTHGQSAQELDIDPDDTQVMASQLREGIVQRKPEGTLSDAVECDAGFVIARPKGHPKDVKNKGERGVGGG